VHSPAKILATPMTSLARTVKVISKQMYALLLAFIVSYVSAKIIDMRSRLDRNTLKDALKLLINARGIY